MNRANESAAIPKATETEVKPSHSTKPRSEHGDAGPLTEQPAPESLREILELPVVQDFVEFLRESNGKQVELAKKQSERQYEIEKRRLELEESEAKREHELEHRHIAEMAAHAKWLRWLLLGVLLCLGALFVVYRDKPEIALGVAKDLAAIAGAAGVAWAIAKKSGRHAE